ncbi:3-carboxy-cis,cis-muconate cycloisomerase [Streptomyces piniterrae]|uniref:3-carboxy-cis,cis-muconate cycloisomerase n=1 Tax=Streptomyces piniterrae TaxID=2571125 RepID=A0A4U0N7H7_9ACTN|nr:3-carboxy-cis,cis-muconate cycloisomerase [Streptomyces piniterrae]TJZ49715.1 3-carboxy-cis,cis-muconate cycloisomerase [Streptomyces piniterrae]
MPYEEADLGLLAPSSAGSAAALATGDAAYLRAMLDAEAALTRAQAGLGLAPESAAAAVTAAAADTHRHDPRDLALRARAAGNPVVPLVADLTAAVAACDPEAAAYVHRGATSQDILDTATMLVCARALATVLADLRRTADALRATAAAHRDTPMAGRTLTQHAVPTTFGLKAAGWRALVVDAHDRLAAVRIALPAQLGGAAGTLAAFGAYAEADGGTPEPPAAGPGPGPGPGPDPDLGLRLLAAYAAETGLAEPSLPWHTLRTPIADLAGALAFTAGALGKLAADVLTLSRTEVGELAEGGRGGASSAMPHKANPVRATLITAAARQVPALAAVLYGALAAEDERPAGAWHAEWQPLRDALRLVGGAARDAAELTSGLQVHAPRMRRNLDATGGLITSERLVAALTALTGRDEARRTLDAAARRAMADGIGLYEALHAEAPALAALLSGKRLRQLLDPTDYLGSARALVDRALVDRGLDRTGLDPQEPT